MSIDVVEKIQNAQHGTKRPFKCNLLKENKSVMSDYFATHQLAWAYGENWEMLNNEHRYEIFNLAPISVT